MLLMMLEARVSQWSRGTIFIKDLARMISHADVDADHDADEKEDDGDAGSRR